jgi:glutamate synthase (NADPH/NADH) small chain
VAVVGSGPSGLTVAGDLIQKGHDVTVLEAFHKPGGVLVYGIPEFRLPKAIVAQEVNFLERLGAKVSAMQVVGRTVSLDELFEEGYEAIYLGVGAGLPRFMNMPGENLIGILSANEYLTRANLMKAYLFPEVDTPIPAAKTWWCWVPATWPWTPPARPCGWAPKASRSSTAAPGTKCPPGPRKSTTPRRRASSSSCSPIPPSISGNDKGRLTGMECLKMELGEPDDSGRRRPVPSRARSSYGLRPGIVAVGSGANPC